MPGRRESQPVAAHRLKGIFLAGLMAGAGGPAAQAAAGGPAPFDAAGRHTIKQFLAAHCLECHDHDNSPDFDFDEYWPAVEHSED